MKRKCTYDFEAESRELEQELADLKAKARAESEERQEKIKLLWDLKEQELKAETYKEKQLKRAKAKELRLQRVLRCVKILAPEEELRKIVAELIDQAGFRYQGLLPWSDFCSLMEELIDLARLQDREIEYLMQSRRDWERIHHYYPQQLQNLSFASRRAEWRPHIEKRFAGQNPKQTWERNRRRSHGGWLNSIEYQFGGEGEAAWRKSSFSGERYEPTCLRKIIMGVPINMRELQDLFWPLRRDRFPKDVLQSHSYREGRKIFYRHPVVPILMKELLSEPRERKRAQGKARQIWLSDPDLRIRVLSGIEAHLKSVASDLWEAAPDRAQEWQEWQTEIADPILNVLHPYLPDSAE
jgi:hypothetical protein